MESYYPYHYQPNWRSAGAAQSHFHDPVADDDIDTAPWPTSHRRAPSFSGPRSRNVHWIDDEITQRDEPMGEQTPPVTAPTTGTPRPREIPFTSEVIIASGAGKVVVHVASQPQQTVTFQVKADWMQKAKRQYNSPNHTVQPTWAANFTVFNDKAVDAMCYVLKTIHRLRDPSLPDRVPAATLGFVLFFANELEVQHIMEDNLKQWIAAVMRDQQNYRLTTQKDLPYLLYVAMDLQHTDMYALVNRTLRTNISAGSNWMVCEPEATVLPFQGMPYEMKCIIGYTLRCLFQRASSTSELH